MKTLLQIAYFPLFFGGFIGSGIYFTQAQFGFYAIVLLMAAAIAVSFGAERLVPYNPDWNISKSDRLRDVIHGVVNETMNYAGIFLLAFLPAMALSATLWPTHWPFGLQVLMALVIFDICSTLFHYLSHKNAFFWRFHAVHHAQKRLYGFNGIMKHPVFQLFDSVVAVGPLLLLGIPHDVALVLVYSIFIQLLIQHSNVDMKTGVLRDLFATAEVHRFHHLKGKAGDVNFGLFLSIWDKFLGTSYFERRAIPMADADVGIGSEPNYPVQYLPQMLRPFQAQRPEEFSQRDVVSNRGL